MCKTTDNRYNGNGVDGKNDNDFMAIMLIIILMVTRIVNNNYVSKKSAIFYLLLTISMETKFEASWKRCMFSKSNMLKHKKKEVSDTRLSTVQCNALKHILLIKVVNIRLNYVTAAQCHVIMHVKIMRMLN